MRTVNQSAIKYKIGVLIWRLQKNEGSQIRSEPLPDISDYEHQL